MTRLRGTKPRAPGWWYPWIFVGGMLVVVAVNTVMVSVAVGTFPGLDTERHYDKGLAYNDNLAAARRQAEQGWQMEVGFQPYDQEEDRGHGGLVVRLIDRDGQPLNRLTVAAQVIRPTHRGHDQVLDLAPLGDGRYGGALALPLPGVWDVRILARDDDRHFQKVSRLFVP